MNRRAFARSVAGTLLSASVLNHQEIYAANVSEAAETGALSVPPFKLSVMLWTVFRDLPFEQRLEKVAEAGYRNVELVGEYEKWTDQDFDRANAKRKELGITFDCTAGLKHGLCDCPAIILLSGNVVPGMSVEAQQQSCVDGLKAAAKLVDGKKINGEPIRVLLENIDPEENPKYFLTSVARGFEIIRAVNHPQVQFLYDFFHEQIAEGNLIEKLEKNSQYLGLVHIADVPGRHEPGTGEINYANIFRKLAELKYDRVVAMEFLPSGDSVEQLRAAGKMAIAAATGIR